MVRYEAVYTYLGSFPSDKVILTYNAFTNVTFVCTHMYGMLCIFYLNGLLGTEVTERVPQVLLDPTRQFTSLIGAAKSLVREYHYAVVGFTSKSTLQI